MQTLWAFARLEKSMPEYNTGNPLGSMDPRDLFDNANIFDAAVNSEENTFQDRLGNTRSTLSGVAAEGRRIFQDIVKSVGSRQYSSKAAMDTDLSPPESWGAIVTNDPAPENNGWYYKSGGSGSGSWVRIPNQPALQFDLLSLSGRTDSAERDLSVVKNAAPKITPRGSRKTLWQLSVGQQMLAYFDQLGRLHADIAQKPLKRPRSKNYPQPFLVAVGNTVVSTSDLVSKTADIPNTATPAEAEQPPSWLAREEIVSGSPRIMVYDGASYRQLTSITGSWVAPSVGRFNIIRALRTDGTPSTYTFWPQGIGHKEGAIILQKIVTGQSLSIGSRGFVLNPNGEYSFEPAKGGRGDLFTVEIPSDLKEYCLSLPGGPRPSGTADRFIPIREYADGLLGETISSSWALALRRWSERASLANLRLIPTVSGLGGVPYANLKKGTSVYSAAIGHVQSVNALAKAQGLEHIVHSVSITHGESQPDTDAQTYAGYLLQWVSDYSADVAAITGQAVAPVGLISQMNAHAANTVNIPLGQLLAHDTYPSICLVGPKYQFPYWDQYHLLAEGYVKLGELEAKAERFSLIGKKWQPLRPVSATLSDTTITVRFNNSPSGNSQTAGPVGPLAFDTKAVTNPGNYGFVLTDTATTITSVTLGKDGSSVVIGLSNVPAAGTALEYALQLNLGNHPVGGPRGCLRDTDMRDRSRFDQTYLHNFCVAFRQAISTGAQ